MSKARVCDRSTDGIVVPKPAWVVDICLLWELCVVR